MKERIPLIIVIPVGPTESADNIRDTLESVVHYTGGARRLIILDDSNKGVGEKMKEMFPEIVVLPMPGASDNRGGLYLNLSAAFEFSLRHYDFDVLLKLDVDALIIGHHPEQDAINHFAQNPMDGIIGSLQTNHPGRRLLRETSDKFLARRPDRKDGINLLRSLLDLSRAHGYEPGDHCQGGACFLSYDCVARLSENKLLSRQELCWTRIYEDMLFGMLITSLGLKQGDLATGEFPMGLAWRGLPCSPQELLCRKKKIVHSVRFYQEQTEAQIRAFFKRQRTLEANSDEFDDDALSSG